MMYISLGFIVYMGAFLLLKIKYNKKYSTSSEDFYLAKRKLGSVIGSLTYAATTYSSFMMVGLVGLVYTTGIGAIYFELCYLVSTFLIIIFLGNRLRLIAKERNIISPMELFTQQYGSFTAKVGSFICLLALLPYTAAQFIGIGMILTPFNISFNIGVILASILTFILIFNGGMRSVALSDAIQGIFMITCAVISVLWANNTFEIMNFESINQEYWTTSTFLNLVIPWLFFALVNPQVVQRLFAMENKKEMNKMAILFCGFGFIFTILVGLIAFYALQGHHIDKNLFANTKIDQITPSLISIMPSYLGGFLSLSILFAALSTSNSNLLTLTSMLQKDFVKNEGKLVIPIIVLILTVIVMIIAMFNVTYIVKLAVSSARILLGFVPLYIGILFTNNSEYKTTFQAPCTLLGTVVITLICVNYIPQYNSIITIFSAFLIYFVVGNLEKIIARSRKKIY